MDISKALWFASNLDKVSSDIDDEAYRMDAVTQELSSRIPVDKHRNYERDIGEDNEYQKLRENLSGKSVSEIVWFAAGLSKVALDKDDEAHRMGVLVEELESRQSDSTTSLEDKMKKDDFDFIDAVNGFEKITGRSFSDSFLTDDKVASAMREKDYTESDNDDFDRYFGHDSYDQIEKPTRQELDDFSEHMGQIYLNDLTDENNYYVKEGNTSIPSLGMSYNQLADAISGETTKDEE